MTQDLPVAYAVPIGAEPYRPQAHFTPRRNWINDPNGLVYFEGEYHLFYQYNPEGMEWGHMSWGHAVSPDLARWRELPVAIPETDQMIFSGSIVVDWNNVSGLGDGTAPPLLAYFTAFDAARGIQSQHLAFSHDRGRTFAHYTGNPIIDLDHADFRDPKVFYHEDSAAWIMVVALAKDHVVQFYRSENLIDWRLSGTFGPAGSTSGQWECPDLMLVPMAGEGGHAAWVLKIDVDTGLIDGGSGAQYFVGAFDGHTFVTDPDIGNSEGELVDYGTDFYAAITWAELPASQPGPVWIGWQSNHQSGRFYPTDPWRGAMSLPRRLFLYRDGARFRLGQQPVLPPTVEASAAVPSAGHLPLGHDPLVILSGGNAVEGVFDVQCDADGWVQITLGDDRGAVAKIVIDQKSGSIEFTRSASIEVPNAQFARNTTAQIAPGNVRVQIILDGPLIELFVNGGHIVYTFAVFPSSVLTVTAHASTDKSSITRMLVNDIKPTMLFN